MVQTLIGDWWWVRRYSSLIWGIIWVENCGNVFEYSSLIWGIVWERKYCQSHSIGMDSIPPFKKRIAFYHFSFQRNEIFKSIPLLISTKNRKWNEIQNRNAIPPLIQANQTGCKDLGKYNLSTYKLKTCKWIHTQHINPTTLIAKDERGQDTQHIKPTTHIAKDEKGPRGH